MANCSFNPTSINKDLIMSLAQLCAKALKSSDIRQTLTSGINQIGKSYQQDTETIVSLSNYIDNYIRTYFKSLESYIPDNISIILSSDTNIEEVQNPQEVEIEQFTPNTDTTNILQQYYKEATRVMLNAQSKLNSGIVNTVIVDRKNGTIINNQERLNESIKNYQQELVNTIVEFINENNRILNSQELNIEDYQLYDEYGNFNNKILDLFQSYKNIVGEPSSDVLNKYYNKMNLYKSKQAKLYLDAYYSYILLSNFDTILCNTLKNSLKISAGTFGKFVSTGKYKLVDKFGNIATSWRTNNDISAADEMDDVTRLLILTTPFYKKGSKSRELERTLLLNEYNNIITSIYQLVYNKRAHEIKFDPVTLGNLPRINSKYRQDIQNLSLADVIINIRANQSKWLGIVFDILNDSDFYRRYRTFYTQNFTPQQLDVLYTTYNGIFRQERDSEMDYSLLEIKNKFPDQRTYYEFITEYSGSIAKVKFGQYYQDEDGTVKLRMLSDTEFDKLRLNIESQINSKLATTDISALLTKYNASYNNGIFTINVGNFRIEYTPIIESSQAFKFYKKDANGEYQEYNSFESFDLSELIPFIDQFIFLDLQHNELLRNNYLQLSSSNGNIQYHKAIDDLVKLSSSIFFNTYFNHNIKPESISYDGLKNKVTEIFGEKNLITIDKLSGEINLVSKLHTPVLRNLSSAYGITLGINTSNIVKDSQNNGIAVTTVTRLLDSFMYNWKAKCMTDRSPSKNFILFRPGMLKDLFISREANLGEISKNHTEFNVCESFYTSFIYDYLSNIVSTDRSPGFIPSVVSDKPSVPKLVINFDEIIPKFNKSLRNFTYQDVMKLMREQFGEYFTNTLNNIISDYNKLNTYIDELNQNSEVKIPKLNPLTNFEEFNIYGNQTSVILKNLVKRYNEENLNSPVELIDQTHFIENKNGTISFNRVLISKVFRFNPEYFKNFNIQDYFGQLTSFNDFVKQQEKELVFLMLLKNFQIDTVDDRGIIIKSPEIEYLRKKKDWINKQTGQVILAKYKLNGVVHNISSMLDYQRIIGYNNKLTIDSFTGSVELHPDLKMHNWIDYLFGQEFMYSTVGGEYGHPFKIKVNSDLQEEAGRYLSQDKRNVSLTASMWLIERGGLYECPYEYNYACIKDLKIPVFNVMGDWDRATVYDGSTFVDAFTVLMENNSLQGNNSTKGSETNEVKKFYGHDLDTSTGTGFSLKTACFGLTNNGIRESKFFRLMMRKMSDIKWTDENGNEVIYNLTNGLFGNPLMQNPIYYRRDGKHYRITDIQYVGQNGYNVTEYQCEEDGQIIPDTRNNFYKEIDTNYALWELFGGMNSESIEDGRLKLSEQSIKSVVNVMNQVGIPRNGKAFTPEEIHSQDDLYQFMKHSLIHYVPTQGAIKQGVKNINEVSSYTDQNSLSTGTTSTAYIGEQLDASHEAEEAQISETTQVISALAARGYTMDKAEEIYNALASVVKASISEQYQALQKYLNTNDPTEIKNLVAQSVIKYLANNETKGLAFSAARDLIRKVQTGQKVTYQETQGVVPFSSPDIFNQLSSIITSIINKSGIKKKFSGLLAVMNPSYGIYKLYGDRPLSSFQNDEEILRLQSEQYDNQPLTTHSELKIGRSYKFYNEDGTYEIVSINTPIDYWNNSDRFYNASKVVEYIVDGRDLACYDVRFRSGGKSYNIWDLDIVKAIFYIRSQNDSNYTMPSAQFEAAQKTLTQIQNEQGNIVYKKLLEVLYQRLQNTLEIISKGLNKPVSINNQSIFIDPESVVVSDYEAIAPIIHRNAFGLEVDDDLKTIADNQYYFLEKMIKNWKDTVQEDNYTIGLKKLNGKHVYLLDSSRSTKNLKQKPIEFIEDGDKIYRVNEVGERMYRLSSIKDKIYVDEFQNEIIVTDNIEFYIESSKFNSLRISSKLNGKQVGRLLETLNKSNKKSVQRFLRALGKYKNNVKQFNQVYDEQINNVSSSLEETGKLPDNIIQVYPLNILINNAQEIHTSFIKSLEVTASRTPSQAMQSFMAMKIAMFYKSTSNNTFVNHFQLWLQGSDY